MNAQDDPSSVTCILGLGLIGGSLLRDLRAAGRPAFGWNRSAGAAVAAQDEGFDVATDLAAVLRRAADEDALIVVATPLPAVGVMLDAIAEHAPGCAITDVVSVKQPVLDEVRQRGLTDCYVGGHPMAGTADSGWEASLTGLFDGASWVVTFDHALDTGAEAGAEAPSAQWVDRWQRVVRLAAGCGAEVIPARSRVHDSAVARISHLPHLLAEALAVVGDQGGALSLSLAAGSFRDGTRVAGTDPSLVRAMCEGNREALLVALDEALTLLTGARESLAGPAASVEDLTEAGHRSRIRYEARSGRRSAGAAAGATDGAAGGMASGATDGAAGEPQSTRPVIRFQPGEPNWVTHLEYAEGIGARIEIF